MRKGVISMNNKNNVEEVLEILSEIIVDYILKEVSNKKVNLK